jgi:hypothetical protein
MFVKARTDQTIAVLLALPLSILGCSIPLTVRRVDPAGGASVTQVKGVRYALKRPITKGALRPAADAKIDELRAMGKDLCAKRKGSERTECAKQPMEARCNGYRVDLVLEQELSETWVYEAEYTPNFLADTDATLTLNDDGTLAGVSAGETDQILPFIEAVAGLAVSAAKSAAKSTLDAEDSCVINALQPLVQKQIVLLEREKAINKKIDKLRSDMTSAGAVDLQKTEKRLAALVSELERTKRDKGENKRPFKKGEALICIDKRRLDDQKECRADEMGTLLRIDLETRS